MEQLTRLIHEGNRADAWPLFFRLAREANDYAAYRALGRVRRKLLRLGPPPAQPANARVAILGGATTDLIHEPLELALESIGVAVTLHHSGYNAFAREMLEPASGTVAFGPDVAVLITVAANLPRWPPWNASAATVEATVADNTAYWLGLCRSLHEHARCDLVLGNFPPLPLRPFGTAGVRMPGEPNRFLRAVNERLACEAPPWLHIHDVAALASLHGAATWVDPRFWFHAKQPVSFDGLVPYVRSLAQLVGALFGRAAKCVVLDLDNTLWGGVVGDDGPAGIVIGEGDPRGEAFLAFQRYLRQLKERGVVLTVCSKNDEAQALAPMATRPEMVLRREDFAVFRANWRPKSENLEAIATALNIGLDALVFVDDNPAEREQVRQALPDVRVVELGDDPADYPLLLDRTGWLDQVAVSTEDAARTGMLTANAARADARATLTDYDAYLRSLEQRAVIAPFEERYLDRITQLTNKTNQFNLTTQRLSRSELAALMTSENHVTASVRVVDRFGDNGLISVLAARGEGSMLWIDLWLMSCRVLGRGVEQLICNWLAATARRAGYSTLHGVYRPTARNGVVRDLYKALGFAQSAPHDGGDHWALELGGFRPFQTAITIVGDY